MYLACLVCIFIQFQQLSWILCFFVPCLSAFSNCYTNKKAVPIISSLFFIDVFFFPIPLPTYSTSEHSAQNDRLSALRDEDSKLWCTITPTFQGSRSLSCNWKHHQTQDQNPWGETLLGSMEKAHETSNKESKHQKESELSKTKPILFRISLKSYSNHGPQWGGHINHKVIRWWPFTSTATPWSCSKVTTARPHCDTEKLTGSWIQTKLEINILQLIKQSSHSQRVEYKNGPIRFVCEMC